MQTLCDLFSLFGERGDKSALIFRTGVRRLVFSYSELYDLSLRMSRLLAERGVNSGDRVVLWAPNSPWWAVVFWGCIARGAIVVPVDFMSGKDRAAVIAEMSEARFAVQSRFKPEGLDAPGSIMLEDLEHLLRSVEPLNEMFDAGPPNIVEIVYTSGTTGNPKGVVLTHGNLVANLWQVNKQIPVVGPQFVFLSLLPLSHLFEQTGGFLTPLYRGASIVHLRTLKPSAIMEALSDEDIHAVICVPRLLQLLKSSIERELEMKHLGGILRFLLHVAGKVPSWTRKALFFPVRRKFGRHFVMFVSGGASLAPEIFRFWSAMGFTVLEGYGLTECAPVLTANTMDQQIEGSVGRPLPGVEVRFDNDEIVVRGENVFQGYYRNEQATREAFTSDGWFRTGDLGRLDTDGNLRILGRRKEMIVTGAGINVFPDELENVLNAVAGLRESCVIGFDRGSGEEVYAVLIPDGSGRAGEEIIAEANNRIDPLQRITGFSIWPEPEFPKTTTLKIRKFLVKERIAEGKGGEGSISSDPLVNLIARVTESAAGIIREDSSLVNDLGLTSIGRLELVNYIEQEYRLDLEDSVIGPLTTVGELRGIIVRREKPRGPRRFRFWTNSSALRGVRRLLDLCFHDRLVRIFASIEVSGLENLEDVRQPVVFISNHQSYLDQPVVLSALPSQWRYATATAAWEEFFFSNYRNLAGKLWKRFTYDYGSMLLNLFPISQTSGFRNTLAFMGKLVDHRINILLFPEGERSVNGQLLPFRPGIGVMVRELSVPLVPVRIFGLDKVYPPGAVWPGKGRVRVVFGKPLVFTSETPAEVVELSRRAVESLE